VKRIAEFLEGKIRRSEAGDHLHLEPLADDPELGAGEGRLASGAGWLDFYRSGLRTSGGVEVRYVELAQIALELPAPDGTRRVALILADQRRLELIATSAGAVVLHATLRWIGRALLGRPLDTDGAAP
jgi:hypothetical protein